MKFGLKENIIHDVMNIFQGFPEVEEVILYGSRAKGNYKTGSDIDLTFVGDAIDLSLLNKVSLKLDDLYLPYTFDLSIFRYIDNPELADHINRAGISLYRKNKTGTVNHKQP